MVCRIVWSRCFCNYTSHSLFPAVVLVNWTMTQTMINVTEGDGVEVRLSAEAFGMYAYPIEVGVVCAEIIAADVEPGVDTITSTATSILVL